MRCLRALAGLLPPALAALQFVHPPPFDTQGGISSVPVYGISDIMEIVWTDPSNGTTANLQLFQADGFSVDEKAVPYINTEIIAQHLPANITTYKWGVRTASNLARSNLFFLILRIVEPQGGAVLDSASSHYFNITQRSATVSTTASTSTTSTTSTAAGTGTGTANSSAAPPGGSDGLTTGAKIGIGVAIPCAVILGAVASWAIFGKPARQARRTEAEPTQTASDKDNGSSVAELGVAGELYKPAELSSSRYPVELSAAGERPAELSSLNEPAELSVASE